MLVAAQTDENLLNPKLKRRLYNGMMLQQLKTTNEPNIDYVMEYLEHKLAKDELDEMTRVWDSFNEYRRGLGVKI